MAYEENYKMPEIPQNIILESRRKLSVSAVKDVESFDEETVVMNTAKGALIIRGSDLHIEKLSLDSGDALIKGMIDSLEFEGAATEEGGFFSKIFR